MLRQPDFIKIQFDKIMFNIIRKIFLLGVLIAGSVFAQSDISVFTGKVSDEKGNPLISASVVIKENNNGSYTDKNGVFKIQNKPGSFTVEITFLGFEKRTDRIVLEKGKTLEKKYALISTSFEIGGIQVTADNRFIPIAPETKTTVTSADIEHMQASSLNDVLKFAPGVETTNPDLKSPEKAVIRGGDPLGTQIVLDGIPMSNNANMQYGIGTVNGNSGIDLRSIPAENIKEVEIVRGIPSAKYGDLADGLLIVKTKAMAEPFRAKYKYNPNVNEFNFSGGFNVGSWTLNGNLNIAANDYDKRVSGDGYTRFAGQVSAEYESEEYGFKNILYATRALDETKEKPQDETKNSWYNRDMNLKYTGNFSYRFSSFSSFDADFSASYTHQDTYQQTVVSRDNTVISGRLDEGAQLGRIVFGSYLGKKWIKGEVWNLYANLSYNFRFFTADYLHSWTAGANWRNDFNKGDGIIFDPLFPPSVTSSGTQRLRTYDELPAYNILSLFAEDKITGNFFKPFTLQIGARYETYRPKGINLKGLFGGGDFIESYNGSFFNPRINFSYNLAEKTQVRLSFGVTSKSPPMGMMFAQKKYYDIIDTVSVVNAAYPDSNFALISTYIREVGNQTLKGYKQKKYELSIDQQIGGMGFSLTGFINNSDNMFESQAVPAIFYKKSFPNYPDFSTYSIKDTVVDDIYQYQNKGWMKIRGVEFTLRTERIPIINTVFNFDASYTYDENGIEGGSYFSAASRYISDLGMYVIPQYNQYVTFHKNLLLNYKFEIQAKSLGIWLTVHVQQKLIDISGRTGFDDTLATGYFNQKGELISIPDNERASAKYEKLRMKIQKVELNDVDKPNRFLFNVRVSKSLWQGASVSFYVNNFFNYRPLFASQRQDPSNPVYERLNPEIFYGIEFGTSLGDIL
jgi:outer membrane receptor for ferrienterochelin and colicin